MSFAVVYTHADGRCTYSPAASKVQAEIAAGGAIRLGTAVKARVVRVESVHVAPVPQLAVASRDASLVGARPRSERKRSGARREARSRR